MRLALSLMVVALSAGAAACGSNGSGSSGGSGGTTSSGGSGGTTSSGGSSSSTGGSGGSGGCRGQSDCDSGAFCAAYTLPPLCGGMEDVAFDETCTTDADCAAGGPSQICVDTLCVFPHGGALTPLHCRKGCDTSPDCGPGLACNAAHHCEPASCAGAADCGANFDCTDSKCAPKSCSSDQDCGDYCVNSTCSETIGKCQPAVP